MQAGHDVAPSSENDPAEQVTHTDRPVLLAYVPPAQFEQVPALLAALIFPIKHMGQAMNPACEYVPATQS